MTGQPARWCLIAAAAALTACAGQPAVPDTGPPPDPQALLQIAALSDPARDAEVPSVAAILAPSEGMRAFVARHVGPRARPGQRLQQLLQGMIDEGYLDLGYDVAVTLTAQQTFERKLGNCLSFTNLFVALARLAELDVRYQIVDIPPNWQLQDRWVVLDNHINTILHKVKVDSWYRKDFVIDFNVADFQGNYPRREVDDAHAFALFYNNRAVEALRGGEHTRAYALFRRALGLNPRLGSLWANLGALLRAAGRPADAEQAYRQALRLEPHNPTAMANLAHLYRATGRSADAQRLEERIAALRNQNPYYFYQRALAAYREGDWRSASTALDRALRLKTAEHQFHYLRALLARQAGDYERTVSNLRRALKYATLPRVKERYDAELQALREAGSLERL